MESHEERSDLRQQQTTVEELLRVARTETVRIVTTEGDEFILEAADAFAQGGG